MLSHWGLSFQHVGFEGHIQIIANTNVPGSFECVIASGHTEIFKTFQCFIDTESETSGVYGSNAHELAVTQAAENSSFTIPSLSQV